MQRSSEPYANPAAGSEAADAFTSPSLFVSRIVGSSLGEQKRIEHA
jgi:hypothetical protein